MPAKRWVLLRRVELYDPAAMTAVVIEGMDLLERKPRGTVLIKPIDRDAIIRAVKDTRRIITVEEHNIVGGRTKAGRGVYTRKAPFVHMRFNGLEGAYKVPAESKNTVSATADGDIRLEGSPEYAGNMGSFMMRIQDMLMPPKT
ncbi:MAG: hypothetical protein ABFC95_02475 [Smithella sp.]